MSENNPQPQSSLDHELELAKKQFDLAQLRANTDYFQSPAGQLQRQFEIYQRIAKPLSESAFVPDAYRGKIGECVIAVEISCRLGIPALTVMQNLCIVKGMPTWMSKFLIACVNSCGRYTTLDYSVTISGNVGDVTYKTWERGSDNRNHEIQKPFETPSLPNLVCTAQAVELSTGKVLTSTAVSIRTAIQEGWYTKPGSKWPSMTELMLRYRAASMWVSTFAPEISMGFRTVEEANDIPDAEYTDIPDAKPKHSKSIEKVKADLRNRATKTDTPQAPDMP